MNESVRYLKATLSYLYENNQYKKKCGLTNDKNSSNGREVYSNKYMVINSRNKNYLLAFLYKICIPICTHQTVIVLYLNLVCVSTKIHSFPLKVFEI